LHGLNDSATHQIDQPQRIFRRRVAAPGDVLVGAGKHEPVVVQRGFRRDVEQRHRHAASRGGGEQATGVDGGIGAQQRVVGTERIVQRASVAQPDMRRAAARHGRRRELVHAICGLRRAVIGDNRRGVVEAAEIEPAAAILIDVERVQLAPDPRPRRLAFRSRLLDLGRHRAALLAQRNRMVHRVARNLLGDRLALGLMRIENFRRGPALQHGRELP
jgi:hypothetical protein